MAVQPAISGQRFAALKAAGVCCVYIYIYTHIRIHVYTHPHIHKYIHAYIHRHTEILIGIIGT